MKKRSNHKNPNLCSSLQQNANQTGNNKKESFLPKFEPHHKNAATDKGEPSNPTKLKDRINRIMVLFLGFLYFINSFPKLFGVLHLVSYINYRIFLNTDISNAHKLPLTHLNRKKLKTLT
jgi:hypothetical protein